MTIYPPWRGAKTIRAHETWPDSSPLGDYSGLIRIRVAEECVSFRVVDLAGDVCVECWRLWRRRERLKPS